MRPKGHILKKINSSFVLCKIQGFLLKFLKHGVFSLLTTYYGYSWLINFQFMAVQKLLFLYLSCRREQDRLRRQTELFTVLCVNASATCTTSRRTSLAGRLPK